MVAGTNGHPDPSVMVDLTKDQLDHQLSAVDAVDAKLGTILSTGSTVLGIVAAVLALRPFVSTQPQPFSLAHWLVLGLTLLTYLILAIVSVIELWDRTWNIGPRPRDVEPDFRHEAPKEKILWGLAARYNADYELNAKRLARKITMLQIGLCALVAESLLIAGGLAALGA